MRRWRWAIIVFLLLNIAFVALSFHPPAVEIVEREVTVKVIRHVTVIATRIVSVVPPPTVILSTPTNVVDTPRPTDTPQATKTLRPTKTASPTSTSEAPVTLPNTGGRLEEVIEQDINWFFSIGLASVIGWLMSFIAEEIPWFQYVSSKRKRLVFLVLCFGVALLAEALLILLGIREFGLLALREAIVAGFAVFSNGTVAHTQFNKPVSQETKNV